MSEFWLLCTGSLCPINSFMEDVKKINSEMPLEKRFTFGKNWSKFVDSHFNPERLDGSINVFKQFTSMQVLKGKTFIDVGCGSGLHSLAAHQMGANEIVSFDFDPKAVDATTKLKTIAGSPSNWTIKQGSVLDLDFVSSLGKFNFVYSWGVLHHTGSVWKAIENTTRLVDTEGHMYLALYSLDVQPNADYWLAIKERYVQSSYFRKVLMEQSYLFKYYYGGSIARSFMGFFKQETGRTRGMELMTDVRDWLGGWPMEFVLDAEAIKFVENLGFKLSNIKKGEACTEFLFQRTN